METSSETLPDEISGRLKEKEPRCTSHAYVVDQADES